jgi:hypothetical protein
MNCLGGRHAVHEWRTTRKRADIQRTPTSTIGDKWIAGLCVPSASIGANPASIRTATRGSEKITQIRTAITPSAAVAVIAVTTFVGGCPDEAAEPAKPSLFTYTSNDHLGIGSGQFTTGASVYVVVRFDNGTVEFDRNIVAHPYRGIPKEPYMSIHRLRLNEGCDRSSMPPQPANVGLRPTGFRHKGSGAVREAAVSVRDCDPATPS